jgi:hypothetical protein
LKGITEDRNYVGEYIHSVLESLKPWLDKDMYFELKERKENLKINSNYGKPNF